MLPIFLAAASVAANAAGSAAAASSTIRGAETANAINRQGIEQRRSIQDDLALRNEPYYNQGIAQIPQILAMAKNPAFDPTGTQYGDKYSQGTKQMLLSSLNRPGNRNLVPAGEVLSGLNASEQGRLLNRRLDQLKIGYGQAGTAGQNLQASGSAIADIGQRIGQTQANAQSLRDLGRQNTANEFANSASYVPLYLNYRSLNSGGN